MYIIFSGPEGHFAGLVDTVEQAEQFISKWPESASYSEITTKEYIDMIEKDLSYEILIASEGTFCEDPLIELNRSSSIWPDGSEILYRAKNKHYDGREYDYYTAVITASTPKEALEKVKARIVEDGNRIPVYHYLDYSNNQIIELE